MRDEYKNRNLSQAATLGDALLAEHMYNNYASPGYANDMYNAALVYDELGQLEKAATLYSASIRHINGQKCQQQNVIVMHNLSNEECGALAMRFSNLAGVLARMEELEQAYDMYTWVESLNSRALPRSTQVISDNLYNMGNIVASLGSRIDEARGLHSQALALRKRSGVQEDILHSLHSLAILNETKGEFKKAIVFADTALEYAEGSALSGAQYYLAVLYEADEQYEKALELYEKVLSEITESDCMRRDYMTVLSRRAYLTGEAGNTEEAIKLYEEAYDMYLSLTGLDLEQIDASFYTNCLLNMAKLYAIVDEARLAEDYMLKSILSRKPEDGGVIKDTCFLIRLYLQSNSYNKLVNVLVYTIMQAGGPDSPFADTMLDMVTEPFLNAENARLLHAALKEINDTEKIKPVIDMWRQKGVL